MYRYRLNRYLLIYCTDKGSFVRSNFIRFCIELESYCWAYGVYVMAVGSKIPKKSQKIQKASGFEAENQASL